MLAQQAKSCVNFNIKKHSVAKKHASKSAWAVFYHTVKHPRPALKK